MRRSTIGLLLIVAVLGQPARAVASESRRAQLIIKALSYDRNIKSRSGDPVTVAVVSSGTGCEDTVGALRSQALRARVAGRRVRIVTHSWSSAAMQATQETLVGAKAAAVFVCADLLDQIRAITTLTRQHDIMSFAGSKEAVKAGVGVGIVTSGVRLVLVVNLKAVRAEGVDLDSSFMRVAGAVR